VIGYLDRLKKLNSEKCATCVLPKLPKPLLAVKTVPAGHVFGKQGQAKVGTNTTAAPFDQEWFEERAAIYEFDTGLSRPEAERRAYLEVMKHG
jgi:hypothetical protein